MPEKIPPGLRIAILDRAFKRRMDERVFNMDLTAVQLRVLGEIYRMEDVGIAEINQRDLEKHEQVTHPTMTGIIKRLEAKGFITCMPSPADRRYKKIVCTERSRNIHQEIAVQDAEVFQELCQGLTQEEIDEFIRVTDVMLDNIAKMR